MRVINVSDVTVVNKSFVVLDNISFDVEMGSFISIVGNNGSGKTTLIKTLSGLLKYNGYININGYSLDELGENGIRKGISVLFDDMNEEILGNTVWDNLVMPLIFLNKSDSYIKKSITDICSLLEIDKNILNKKMILLSNELKQKVLLGMALISKPSILLLDNCLHQLSSKEKIKILKIFQKLKLENKLTIIMTTNDIEDIVYSDRVIVLNKGKIGMDESVKNVLKNAEKIKKYNLGIPFIMDLSIKLFNKKVIKNVYTDKRKLVDELWK